jgi:hypothetical protein
MGTNPIIEIIKAAIVKRKIRIAAAQFSRRYSPNATK